MVRFHANLVVVDGSDPELIIIGFADEQNDEYREAIQLQRAYEFDEQDVELGMDQIYVERNSQMEGGYGEVVRIGLRPGRVQFTVDNELANHLGGHEFEITFASEPDIYARLEAGIKTMLAGFKTSVRFED